MVVAAVWYKTLAYVALYCCIWYTQHLYNTYITLIGSHTT